MDSAAPGAEVKIAPTARPHAGSAAHSSIVVKRGSEQPQVDEWTGVGQAANIGQ